MRYRRIQIRFVVKLCLCRLAPFLSLPQMSRNLCTVFIPRIMAELPLGVFDQAIT